MADIYNVSGCKIYIGGTIAAQSTDFVESDFNSQVWTEIDGWTTMGTFGDNAALTTWELINRGRDVKQKGTANAGSMENVFADIPADAGQIALVAAAQPLVKDNYAFRIELNDRATVSGTNGFRYFIGLVMSAEESGGGANDPRNLNSTIEINSNIVRVAAT